MPGIAFGKNSEKQSIGDILISKTIIPYEVQRINPDNSIQYRAEVPRVNTMVLNRFTNFLEHTYEYDSKQYKSKVFNGALLTGEKIVDNNLFKQHLLQSYDAIGGEMEAYGVYNASEENNKPWLIVKGICDWADGNKNTTTKDIDQLQAANSSVSYCHRVLSTKHIFNDLKIFEYKHIDKKVKEISLEFDDIINIEIPNRYHNKIQKFVPKNRDKTTNYIYYSYTKQDRIEGFLFLGRDIRISKLINDFITSCKAPDNLVICIPSNAIYKMKSLKDVVTKQKLNVEDFFYIDEYIKCITTLQDTQEQNIQLNSNYIDQELFSVSFDDRNKEKTYDVGIGLSIDYFLKAIETDTLNSVSVILGTGGVGKSTFCNKLEEHVRTKFGKKVLKVSGEAIIELTKDTDNFQVNSLVELFEFYKKLDVDASFDIDEKDFELNYITGNIIVLIDGLDEISSVMSQRFNFDSFFKSLNKLNKRFYSSKIIIATRDETIEKYITYSDLDVYRIKGFKEKDVQKFLTNRFIEDQGNIKSALVEIENLSLQLGKHIAPLFVELVCDGIERESIEIKSVDIDIELANSYLNKEKVFDKILLVLLNREIQKQSLNMSLDDMIELLFEIVIVHTNSLSVEEFELFVGQFTKIETLQSYDKYKKNPLLSIINDTVKVKYEAIVKLLQSRVLEYSLKRKLFNKQYHLHTILKDCYQGNSSLYDELKENLKDEKCDILEKITFFIKEFINELDSASYNREYFQRSISGLLYLAVDLSDNVKNSYDRTNLIKRIYNKFDIINNLFIYGKFFPLDFSEIVFMNCHFEEYETFSKCTFPSSVKKPIFQNSQFININLPNKYKLNRDFFESCDYDESFTLAFKNYGDNQNVQKLNLQNDFIGITSKIYRGPKSLNLLKQSYKLKTNMTMEAYLDVLIKIGYLEFNGQVYAICKLHNDNVNKLMTNKTIPSTMIPLYEKYVDRI